jgi:hypothetical protein
MQMNEPGKGALGALQFQRASKKKAREPKLPGWEVLGEDA